MALRTPLSVTPHLYMGDSTGRPLDKGVVYFGEQDKDPEFYPINLFSDDELTKPLAQPVHTKGGYLYDKGDMVEPHAKELIYSVKVLDSYGRKVFYKGAMMRNSWNDDVIEQINAAIIESTLLATNIANNAIVDLTAHAEQTVQNAIRGVAIDANLVTDALTTIVPITASATARTQLDKNRENVNVFDFFTQAEIAAYETSKSSVDAYRPIQEFFDYISENDVGTAYCSGEFYISQGLLLGGNGRFLTQTIVGRLVIRAMNAIDVMLQISPNTDLVAPNFIVKAVGTGSLTFSSRGCRVGIRLGGVRGEHSAARCAFGGLSANYMREVGVSCFNNTTLTTLGDVRGSACGSGLGNYPNYSHTANWSNRVEQGNSGVKGQSTFITVDSLPPENCETMVLVRINKEVYQVEAVDTANNTIKVYPWIDANITSGSLMYMYGALLHIEGKDASVVRVNKVDAKTSGIGVWSAALYAPVIDNLVTQSCGAGLVIGRYEDSAHVGGQINGYYCENNTEDIILNTVAPLSMSILSSYALNLSKLKHSGVPRTSSNTYYSRYASWRGLTLIHNGQVVKYERQSGNYQESKSVIDVTDLNRATTTVLSDGRELPIRTPSLELLNLYGYDSATLISYGLGDDNIPTGVFTIVPPEGYTVNGSSTPITFSGFTAAAVFHVKFRLSSNDFKVSCPTLKKADNLTSSVVYNFPILQPNSQQSTTLTLTGAKLGDVVAVSLDKALLGTRIWGEVTSSNTVTVYHSNTTAEAVDVESGTLTAKII